MLLSLILLAAGVSILAALLILRLGDGDRRTGVRRAIRRERAFRRRVLRPRMRRLARQVEAGWTRPVRRSLADQVRRVADGLDRVRFVSETLRATEQGLAASVAALDALGSSPRPDTYRPPTARARERAREGGLVAGIGLAVLGLALAAGNGWLLYRYVIPELPPVPTLPPSLLGEPLVPAAFAALSVLLGLAYFALDTAGGALHLRALAGVVILLVLGQSGLEAVAAVLAVDALGLVTLSWWGGVAIAILIGGAVALLPPITAATVFTAADRVKRWVRARGRRVATRAVRRQDRIAGNIHSMVGKVDGSVGSLRFELADLEDEVARTLLGGGSDAGHSAAALREIARSVERADDAGDPDGWRPKPAAVAARLMLDVGALLVWMAAAAGTLYIVARGLEAAAFEGLPVYLSGATFAATAVMLVAGALARHLFLAPARSPSRGFRVVSLLIVGTAAAALAVAVGVHAASVLDMGPPLILVAWVYGLLVAAMVASLRVREGIGAVAGLLAASIGAALWLLLAVADVLLAGADRVLVGRRRRRGRGAAGRVDPSSETPPGRQKPVDIWQ